MFEVWFTIAIISIVLFNLNFLIMLMLNKKGIPTVVEALSILWGSLVIFSLLGAMAAI